MNPISGLGSAPCGGEAIPLLHLHSWKGKSKQEKQWPSHQSVFINQFVGADNPRTCGSDPGTHTSGTEPAPVVIFSICDDECREKGPPHIHEYKAAERSSSLGAEESGKTGPRSQRMRFLSSETSGYMCSRCRVLNFRRQHLLRLKYRSHTDFQGCYQWCEVLSHTQASMDTEESSVCCLNKLKGTLRPSLITSLTKDILQTFPICHITIIASHKAQLFCLTFTNWGQCTSWKRKAKTNITDFIAGVKRTQVVAWRLEPLHGHKIPVRDKLCCSVCWMCEWSAHLGVLGPDTVPLAQLLWFNSMVLLNSVM